MKNLITTLPILLYTALVFGIKDEINLCDFGIVKDHNKEIGGTLSNITLLKPNFAEIGFSFSKFISSFKDKQ